MRRDIHVVANDRDRAEVMMAQRTLGLELTGQLDEATRKKLRGLQVLFRLPATGILDMRTHEKLEELRSRHG